MIILTSEQTNGKFAFDPDLFAAAIDMAPGKTIVKLKDGLLWAVKEEAAAVARLVDQEKILSSDKSLSFGNLN
jgi:hypothetical protein